MNPPPVPNGSGRRLIRISTDGTLISALAPVRYGGLAAAGCLDGRRNYEVKDENGNPITDIDHFDDGALYEEKSIAGVTGTQTIQSWVDDNVHTKFYKYLKARDYLEGYENAPIGFRFTTRDVDPALRREIEETVEILRERHPDVDIRLEWTD